MKISKGFALVALIALALAGRIYYVHIQEPRDQEEQRKEQVTRDLYDPYSAQFRNLTNHHGALCGEINAKNKFGAYVGFKRFYSSNASARIEPDDDPTLEPGSAEFIIAGSNKRTFKVLYESNCTGY